ncbi:uncharacterized protein LOC143349306 [Colletes latitarsis]|uniref:uncharacterized protein LOC143349306 n=1 Tax=Colletes latitarsis TaxID=2605962 RepID=UPI00403723D7
MGLVGLVFVASISVALAKPGLLSAPLIARLTPAAPIGPDGRVQDTPEVAVAKVEHTVAHLNERINLANEAARSSSASLQAVVQPTSLLVDRSTVLVPGAPLGPDGRVVDTQEVAVAKAAHAAAQVNERVSLANEAARSVAADLNRPLVANGLVTLPSVGLDGRVRDTADVAAEINLARSSGRLLVTAPAVQVPLVASNAVLVPGAPIGPDGRVLDTPEVAVAKAAHASAHLTEKLNLANEAAKSGGVLAVAGTNLAYGRLVY